MSQVIQSSDSKDSDTLSNGGCGFRRVAENGYVKNQGHGKTFMQRQMKRLP